MNLLRSRQILLDVDAIAALSDYEEGHMSYIGRLAAVAAGLLFVAVSAHADPAKCEKTLITSLLKFKKTFLKVNAKCLDAENDGKISGPCPDAAALLKIQTTSQKVTDKVNAACVAGDLTTLGYSGSCNFKPGAQGAEADCAALPASTPQELVTCLECWKAAELSRYAAILYASHADEVCSGDLGATSPRCSPLDCTTPLPDQRNLTGGDGDCQKGIGKAGNKYLVSREKVLEKCGLAGGTRTSCLADLKVQISLQKAEDKKSNGIHKKCGNRTPVASPPFCCRLGQGNSCVLATDRTDCTVNQGGTVQEGKECIAGSCDPTPGQQEVTWWENCPNQTCGSAPLATLNDLIACVDDVADGTVDDLLCQQFAPGGGWCSPSGAFLDPVL
jgi:hypothetical protein